jgi:DNA-binding response OmpR family regulator
MLCMKVLIVENERKVGQFVERALSEQAYGAKLVGTCSAAREALAESPYDAVVLDLGLPDGDGLDLLREWRAAGFDEPVLILSARDAVQDPHPGPQSRGG